MNKRSIYVEIECCDKSKSRKSIALVLTEHIDDNRCGNVSYLRTHIPRIHHLIDQKIIKKRYALSDGACLSSDIIVPAYKIVDWQVI